MIYLDKDARFVQAIRENIEVILDDYEGSDQVDVLTNFLLGRIGAAENRIKRKYELHQNTHYAINRILVLPDMET